MRAAFEQSRNREVKTLGLDAIRYLYPLLGSIIAKTYLEIIKYTPQIWDFLYDNPDIAEVTREIRQLFSFLDTPKLKALLTEHSPDAFVCTHAVPCSLIAEQKRRGNCKLPLIAIVTDFDVHSYWAHPEVNCYIVANEKSRKTLIARGIAGQKIKVCGIPVDPGFAKKTSKADARKKLGLDPRKSVVLIMGGERGMGPIADVVKSLLELKASPQILVAAGTNEELIEELAPHKKSGRLHVYGFTHQIPLLMNASDILITKPGGLTSSEALVKGLPMIILQPIPGQEERNADYLLKNGCAVKAASPGEIKSKVSALLENPQNTRKISQKMLKISTPHAALHAAEEIERALKMERSGLYAAAPAH